MTKQVRKAVGAPELRAYLDTLSDFAFEVRVLRLLRSNGCRCEHGGSYEDPVTGKLRQFDIRAEWSTGCMTLHLAVECKNIRPDHPLLVLRVPRQESEAHNDITVTLPTKADSRGSVGEQPQVRSLRLDGWRSIYAVGEPVGKSCAQVSSQGSTLSGSDADVYDKWSQALQSARDLVVRAARVPRAYSGDYWFTAVLPFVIVPDGSLWVADYDSDGAITGDPRQEDQTTYLVERLYVAAAGESDMGYLISHLEFLTMRGLERWLEGLPNGQYLGRLFSMRAIGGVL